MKFQSLELIKLCSFEFQGISTTRTLLADTPSDATPISSPLIPISAGTAGKSEGQTENQTVKPKPATVQAILKGIKQVMLECGLFTNLKVLFFL